MITVGCMLEPKARYDKAPAATNNTTSMVKLLFVDQLKLYLSETTLRW